ncbi:MAG: SDR family NAD(P)-dependent oxidoreductase [Candidatus Dormibacteria bacterium]
MTDRVALITGGAAGIGLALTRLLRERGDDVIIADVNDEAGAMRATALGAGFVHCDVRSPDAVTAAVQTAVERYGGLDVAVLNAGVGDHGPLTDQFDQHRYRRTMDVNVDGVVHGVVAALPALRARGGGDIIVTASLAGLTPFAVDPVYTASKHAVVGLVRALAPTLVADEIRVNAVCPGFADTAIIEPIRNMLGHGGMPLLNAGDVAAAFIAVLDARETGQCWFVQPGRPSEPFRFSGVPGPRATA